MKQGQVSIDVFGVAKHQCSEDKQGTLIVAYPPPNNASRLELFFECSDCQKRYSLLELYRALVENDDEYIRTKDAYAFVCENPPDVDEP